MKKNKGRVRMKEWMSIRCNCCGGTLEEKGGARICKYCKTVFEEVETVSCTKRITTANTSPPAIA